MTATVGHLGQVIAIVVVVLIGLGIFIWARWERRQRDQD
jgi:predicted transporter